MMELSVFSIPRIRINITSVIAIIRPDIMPYYNILVPLIIIPFFGLDRIFPFSLLNRCFNVFMICIRDLIAF